MAVLSFSLNANAEVTDVQFSMKLRNYKDVLEGGTRMKAGSVYERLFAFVDSLKAGYNQRRAKKIIDLFDDNPLIVVGRVDYSATNTVSFSGLDAVSKNKIEFIRKTRAEYYKSLEMVYRQNISAHMTFDSVKIVHRDTTEQIYGITLHQKMQSAAYSDKGWIFLMVSMKNPKNPKIHMRSWQEVAFNDGPDLIPSPPKHGSVAVSALPIDSEIKVDNKVVGNSTGAPIEVNRLGIGNHSLEVNLEGYHGHTKTFQVYYHRTTHLEVNLDPISNTLYVNTYPEGAKIYFNGKSLKQLSPVKIDSVDVGNYSLKAKLAGYHHSYYGGYLEPSSFVEAELDLIRIRRMEAIIRSIILPGQGQRFLGHPIKGWAITALQAAAIAYGVYTFTDYINKRNDYQYSLDRFWESDDQHEVNFWLEKYKADQVIMNDAANKYNQAMTGIGIMYVINIADVAFLTRGSTYDQSDDQ